MKLPGFVDLQVNGYKGVDFLSPELTKEEFKLASMDLLSNGTAAFLPTLITSSKEVYKRNLPLIAEAMGVDTSKAISTWRRQSSQYRNFDDFKMSLIDRFPHEKKNITKYLTLVKNVGRQLQLIPKVRGFWQHLTIPFRTKHMGKYSPFSFVPPANNALPYHAASSKNDQTAAIFSSLMML